MLRLVKVLNGNNQCEVIRLRCNSYNVGRGCALVCSGGAFTNPSPTSMPEYVSLSSIDDSHDGKIDAMIVTEDMVFKAEFTGSANPMIGMAVGLANLDSKMDAVSYNTSGKGHIVGIGDDKKTVYVRFRK